MRCGAVRCGAVWYVLVWYGTWSIEGAVRCRCVRERCGTSQWIGCRPPAATCPSSTCSSDVAPRPVPHPRPRCTPAGPCRGGRARPPPPNAAPPPAGDPPLRSGSSLRTQRSGCLWGGRVVPLVQLPGPRPPEPGRCAGGGRRLGACHPPPPPPWHTTAGGTFHSAPPAPPQTGGSHGVRRCSGLPSVVLRISAPRRQRLVIGSRQSEH